MMLKNSKNNRFLIFIVLFINSAAKVIVCTNKTKKYELSELTK